MASLLPFRSLIYAFHKQSSHSLLLPASVELEYGTYVCFPLLYELESDMRQSNTSILMRECRFGHLSIAALYAAKGQRARDVVVLAILSLGDRTLLSFDKAVKYLVHYHMEMPDHFLMVDRLFIPIQLPEEFIAAEPT